MASRPDLTGRPAGDLPVWNVPPTRGLLGGRYRLEAPLGWGGMGEVWQGRHVELGARVAVKLLRPGMVRGEEARRRFLNEARVMAQLNTSHAVRVHDVGVSQEGVPFLVMDLVDGESLAQRLVRERRLSQGTTARLLGQAALGLSRAHAMSIVHRDFKPANVLLSFDEEGRLRAQVTDFGMAKLLRALSGEHTPEGQPAEVSAALTGIGGTPYYMAPEQFRVGDEVTPLVDVWAFGVVAYECLVGVRPFEGDSLEGIRRAVVERACAAPSACEPSLPRSLDRWFERACAVDPRERFGSIRFAAEALAEALEVSAVASRPSTRVEVAGASIDPLAITADLRSSRPPPLRPAGAPAGSARSGAAGLLLALLGGVVGASAVGATVALRPAAPAPPAVVVSVPVVSVVSVPVLWTAEPPDAGSASARPALPRRWPPAAASLPDYRPFPGEDAPLPPSFKRDPY